MTTKIRELGKGSWLTLRASEQARNIMTGPKTPTGSLIVGRKAVVPCSPPLPARNSSLTWIRHWDAISSHPILTWNFAFVSTQWNRILELLMVLSLFLALLRSKLWLLDGTLDLTVVKKLVQLRQFLRMRGLPDNLCWSTFRDSCQSLHHF